ncbi:MAG: pyridoxal phosphate-dependent aminotransferase [Lachnospiraceae bacterium]|nr:pyridoxal phosphate-dependent aminotransferase [Lachnospiraceae bacterium]
MTYDFDTVISRKKTDSLKWDVKDNELPMWVADMDFKTAPEIIKDLEDRVSHGIFGYSIIPDEWYDAYISWWKKRHDFTIEKEWLVFCTGVIPAISSTVRKLTSPNEKVVIQTPVYNVFFNCIFNNGCRVLQNELIYENGEYRMDFEDLEQKLSDPQTTLMILCNPQNPSGKIWDKDTLQRVGKLCVKYNVAVISDEIHCDIITPGKKYVPFASVSTECRACSITCIAPTKAFNLAGLHSAAVFIPNPYLRHKIWRALNTDEVAEPNAFAITAAVSAFTKGEPWLDALNSYIDDNRKLAEEYIDKRIPFMKAVRGEATYLIWLDIKDITSKLSKRIDTKKLSRFVAEYVREKTGLFVTEGDEYGDAGEGFLRINVACPKSVLKDGLERLENGIDMLVKEYDL